MSATDHRIHGLAADEIAPDWPPLTPSEVDSVLAGFPALRGPTTITWRSPRPLSAAARVLTGGGEVFIKRHHADVRTPATLTVEHAFIAHLRRHGIPIPDVLADAEGRTAIAHGPWTYEVHAIAAGIDVYRDAISWSPLTHLGQARHAGRMLARLHDAASGFHAPQRDTSILVSRDVLLRAPDLGAAIRVQCRARPMLANYLKCQNWPQQITRIQTRHRALQPRLSELPRLWTHNDWHASNLFWSDAGSDATISAVLDFGLASPTFALYDLATAIERNAIAWMQLNRGMQAIYPDTARELIDGYTQIRPLSRSKCKLLADLLPIVHTDFALSEVEYFYGILHSIKHADVAWHTFALGHATWFDTAPGQALLDAIGQKPE